MNSEFQTMTISELKQYVLQHRADQAAFEALMDQVDAQPQQQIYNEVDAHEFRNLVEQHCNSITVRDVEQGLSYWKHNEALSLRLRNEIVGANVLFVPFKKDQGNEEVFAADAEHLVEYLRELNRGDLNIDFCVDDDKYRIEALYSDPITITAIGTIVISSIVAPVIKDLILDYIRGKRQKGSHDSEIRLTLIIDNEQGLIQEIRCVGSSSDIEKLLPEAIDQVLEKQKLANDSVTETE